MLVFSLLWCVLVGGCVIYSPDVQTSSFYIHWPFCAYKCHFCPFISFAGHEAFMERYHHALCAQIENFANTVKQKPLIETIFVGGGTPSTCPDHLLLDTFDKLLDIAPFSKTAEVTIEVNPGTVRREQLEIWKQAGVNRLSIGVQSLNDAVLKNLNRMHKAQDVYRLLEQAKRYFENISIDLILGLPGVSDYEWKKLLETVVAWPIMHISIYFLTIHEKTPLYYRIKKGEIEMAQEDDLVDLYDWSVNFLSDNGFARYEISNFAKEGYESKHNKIYWERKPYKGFGLAACSFDGAYRYQNYKNLNEYMERIEKKESGCQSYEKLTEEQVRLEELMLGLRTDEGVSRGKMFEGLSKDKRKRLENKIAFLKEKKCIYEKNGRFVISPNWLTIENEIVLELLV